MIEAAKALDMSRSMVTRYLSEMESWSETRLLHRSTRRLSLTSDGAVVLEHCRQLLQTAGELAAVSSAMQSEPSGSVRISCSQFVAEDLLVPDFVGALHDRYPSIAIDLHITNRLVDLIEDRIDLAIRIAQELDPNLISRKLANCHSTVCASPLYLQPSKTPTTLDQLSQLNCLAYSCFEHGAWQFRNAAGIVEEVPVSGNLSANASSVLLRATLAGQGISMLPRHTAKPYLDTGQLIELLPAYPPLALGVHVVYRSRQHMPQATRAVIDTLVDYFATLDL